MAYVGPSVHLPGLMHFLYVDESGDPGVWLPGRPVHLQPSRHYILTGLIIPADAWRKYLDVMINLRRRLRTNYGLPVRVELHGTELVNTRGNKTYARLGGRRRRIALYRETLLCAALMMPRARVINISVDKLNAVYASTANSQDLQETTWQALIQRFSTFLRKDCDDDLGMVFADQTNEMKIRRLLRRMRVFNMVPSRYGGTYSVPVANIAEDPVMRNSQQSYFVQLADLVSHALYRKLYAKGSYKTFHVDRLFDVVDSILLKAASQSDPQGIVRL